MNNAPQPQTTANIELSTVHADWAGRTSAWRVAQRVNNHITVNVFSAAKGQGYINAHGHVSALLGHSLLQQKGEATSESAGCQTKLRVASGLGVSF